MWPAPKISTLNEKNVFFFPVLKSEALLLDCLKYGTHKQFSFQYHVSAKCFRGQQWENINYSAVIQPLDSACRQSQLHHKWIQTIFLLMTPLIYPPNHPTVYTIGMFKKIKWDVLNAQSAIGVTWGVIIMGGVDRRLGAAFWMRRINMWANLQSCFHYFLSQGISAIA